MQEFEFLQSVYACNAVHHSARLPTNMKTTYMQRVVSVTGKFIRQGIAACWSGCRYDYGLHRILAATLHTRGQRTLSQCFNLAEPMPAQVESMFTVLPVSAYNRKGHQDSF